MAADEEVAQEELEGLGEEDEVSHAVATRTQGSAL